MTEAEISNQILALTGVALTGLSVFFAVFSGYVVGWYFFLRRASLATRLAAFVFVTLAFFYLGTFASEMSHHARGLHEALANLAATKPLTASGRALLDEGPLLSGSGNARLHWMNMAGLVVNYLALLYLTFFHRWREH